MDIRPIRTGKDHTDALREIERLWGAEIGTPDGDKLDVLATLVDAYENIRWPIEALDPVETIKAHMQATARDQSDLAKVLGSRSRASEVMARKRPLTLSMVRKLAANWHLPSDTLISPYRLGEKASAGRKTRKKRNQKTSGKRRIAA
jgi:HTH-type transcriptional regulator/antitoxin HigA